jgi:hypothetical protein
MTPDAKAKMHTRLQRFVDHCRDLNPNASDAEMIILLMQSDDDDLIEFFIGEVALECERHSMS